MCQPAPNLFHGFKCLHQIDIVAQVVSGNVFQQKQAAHFGSISDKSQSKCAAPAKLTSMTSAWRNVEVNMRFSRNHNLFPVSTWYAKQLLTEY